MFHIHNYKNVSLHQLLCINKSTSTKTNYFNFLITDQVFTIPFNRSHDTDDCKQEKLQLNIILVLKEERIKLNNALAIDLNFTLL